MLSCHELSHPFKVVNPQSLQMWRINDREGMIDDDKIHITPFVQKYSLTLSG